MGIPFSDSIKIRNKKQNFERDSFKTIEEMKNFSRFYLPSIFHALCEEDGNMYIYNEKNSVDPITGRWRIMNSEPGKTPVRGVDYFTNDDLKVVKENVIESLDQKAFIIKDCIISFNDDNICKIENKLITSNTFAIVCFSNDCLEIANNAGIIIDTYDGYIQITSENKITDSLSANIVIQNITDNEIGTIIITPMEGKSTNHYSFNIFPNKKETTNKHVYSTSVTELPLLNDNLTSWLTYDENTEIDMTNINSICIAEVNENYLAIRAGLCIDIMKGE